MIVVSRHEWHCLNANPFGWLGIDKNGLACENLGCHPIPGSFDKEAVDVSEYRPTDS